MGASSIHFQTMESKRPLSPFEATEVVIVGGGMVGLTLGHALASAGIDVVVIERMAPAAVANADFDGRVSAIAHGSQRVLETLGLWDSIAERAQPIQEIRVADGDSPLFLHFDHCDIGDTPLGYIVENRHIREALSSVGARRDRIRLYAPGEVASISRGRARVEIRLASGTIVRARLAIAADGRNSALRRDAGIRVTTWRYPQVGIVCTVAHELPHHGVAHERFLPAGPFAILPMTDDRSSLVWTERADLASTMMALGEAEFTVEVGRRFGDFLGQLEVVGRRWSYPLSLLHAERYVSDRLALVGDAAHTIHPIAGQGLNLGLRDVAALAESLVDSHRLGIDIGAATVLEQYQRWRRFDSLTLIAVTDGLNRLFSNHLMPLRVVRDLGLAAADRSGPFKRMIMRHAMGTLGHLPRLVRGQAL